MKSQTPTKTPLFLSEPHCCSSRQLQISEKKLLLKVSLDESKGLQIQIEVQDTICKHRSGFSKQLSNIFPCISYWIKPQMSTHTHTALIWTVEWKHILYSTSHCNLPFFFLYWCYTEKKIADLRWYILAGSGEIFILNFSLGFIET